MQPHEQLYRAVSRLFAGVIAAFGITILVVTIVNGGGPLSLGVLLGAVFTGLGVGRLYLASRPRT